MIPRPPAPRKNRKRDEVKKQITIETTPDQELVIGLLLTGHLSRATQAMIGEYFEPIIEKEQKLLDAKVQSLFDAAGIKPYVEVEGLDG